jgi:glycerol uptake facilitator-like aquaporin
LTATETAIDSVRALAAEFIGAFALIFIGAGAAITLGVGPSENRALNSNLPGKSFYRRKQ